MTEKKNIPSEFITKLVNKGKKNCGVLTYGEIMDTLQSEDLSPDEIDDMYEIFSSKGIEIVDELPDDAERVEEPEVIEKEDKLFMSFGTEVELIPESNNKLFISDSDADVQIEYVFNNKNEIELVYYIEGGVKSEIKKSK